MASDNGVSKSNGNGKKILVFLASSTPEKLRDLQYIAEHKKWPVYFLDIRELLGAFHSIKEDKGSRKGNADVKLDSIARRFIDDDTRAAAVQAVENLCAGYGIACDPKKIFLASEDGGSDILDPALWEKIDKSGIPQEALDLITQKSIDKAQKEAGSETKPDPKKTKSRITGPGSETASVLSAVGGPENWMRRVLAAARSLSYSDTTQVKITDDSTLNLVSVDTLLSLPASVLKERQFIKHLAENKKLVTAEGRAINYLYPPDTATIDPAQKRTSTYDFVRIRDDAGKACTDTPLDYITQHSGRSKMVDDLAEKLNLNSRDHAHYEPLQSKPLKDGFWVGLLPQLQGIDEPLARYTKTYVDMQETLRKTNGYGNELLLHFPHEVSALSPGELPEEKRGWSPIRRILGNIGEMIEKSDGFLLLPDVRSGATPEDKFEKFWMTECIKVARQIEPRDMPKPFVILNYKGCHDDLHRNHQYLVNLGMTKDHNLQWPERLGPDDLGDIRLPASAKVESNAYYDIVHCDSNNPDDIMKAGMMVMNARRKRYQRRKADASPEFEEGVAPEHRDRFKVAVFCSASNENTVLNDNMRRLGHDLSCQQCDIIYGGGDRYTMGAVLEGVVQYREELATQRMSPEEAANEAYIAGFSTKPLLVAETEKGCFSGAISYRKQCRDIYQRIADMLDSSDAIVVAPGGMGTVQEWVAPMMLKHIAPEFFRDKPMVIYNPALSGAPAERKVWDMALRSLLGEDYELLTSKDEERRAEREAKSAELGIYVETEREKIFSESSGKAQGRLARLRESWQESVARSRASVTKARLVG